MARVCHAVLMMTAQPRVVGAVLAGGKSKRMGTDKAALVLHGETLGARAVRVLRASADDVVCLGHGRGVPDDVLRIADVHGVNGPVAGILSLLRSGRADVYVVLPVDMPGIEAVHLRALVAGLSSPCRLRDDQSGCAAFAVDGAREPLPFAMRACARDVVEASVAAGVSRIVSILEATGVVDVPLPQSVDGLTDRAVIRNVNTLADFEENARFCGER